MMLRRTRAAVSIVALSLVSSLLSAPAAAQPAAVPIQGYLTNGTLDPVSAAALPATLRLYSQSSGGTAFHTEAATLLVEDGHFTYYVGTAAPLDLTQFAGGEVYVGVTIGGGDELTPRTRVGTTPYAAYAGRVPWSGITGVPASLADGDQDTTYTAALPLQLDLGTRTFGLSSFGCEDGDAWVWDGPSSSWQCAPAAGGGATYAAGAGLALDVGTGVFSLQAPTCGDGQYSRWMGPLQGWVCATDATGITELEAGEGITVLGNRIGINAELCDDGEFSRWNGLEWECDTPEEVSFTGGAGIQVSGGVISTVVSGSCDPGRFARWTGLGWVCEADNAGVTSLSGGAGISIGGTAAAPTVSTVAPDCTGIGYSMWNGTAWTCVPDGSDIPSAGGGLYVDGDGNLAIDGRACGAGQVLSWSGSAWACVDDNAGITTLTPGDGIGITQGSGSATVRVAAQACTADNAYSYWDGDSWECKTDVSSTYSAGDGLTMTGTQFRVVADTCVEGQASFWTGTAWTCVPDERGVTSVTAAAGTPGITVGGTATAPTVAINSPLCEPDEYSRWTAGGWDCVPDVSAAYSAGNGLTLNPTTRQFSTAALTCGSDEYAYWTGSQWLCRPDLGVRAVTGSNGLTTSGSDVRVALTDACGANEYLTWSGSGFTCKSDVSSTLTPGDGLQLTGSNQLRVNAGNCTGTNYLQWNGTAWGCAPDQGFTSLVRGVGLTGTDNEIRVNRTTNCDPGNYLTWSTTSGFVCTPDVSTTYTAANGLTLTGTNQVGTTLSTACQAGSFLTWTGGATGTWGCEADRGIRTLTLPSGGGGLTITGSGTTAATITTNAVACTAANGHPNSYSYWDGDSWECRADVSTTLGTLATGGILINASNQVVINSATCGSDQYSRWLGTGASGGWTCIRDVTNVTAANSLITVTPPTAPSTTYTVGLGAPASCTAGQFLQRSGSTWVCASALSSITAGSGLNYNAGSLTMPSLATCASGRFHRWDSSAGWVCELDTGAVNVAAGAGLTGTYDAGSRTVNIAINGTACSGANQASRWNNGAWTCVDTLPTLPANSGLQLTGTGGRSLSINSTVCTGTQVSKWTASGWTCVEPLSATSMAVLRGQNMLATSATMTWSAANYFSWTGGAGGNRLILISAGRGSHFSTDGYFSIIPPPVDTAIQTWGGATSGRTWTAAGVLLNSHDVLYYALPIGANNASVAGNFHVARHTSNFVVPDNWIPIAQRSDGTGLRVHVNGGVYIHAGGTYTPSAARAPDTNNFQARVYRTTPGDNLGCDAGQAIRSIAANGQVTCEPIPQGDITAVFAGNGMTGGSTSGDATLGISPNTYALSTSLRASQDDLSDTANYGCVSTNWGSTTTPTARTFDLGFTFTFGGTAYTQVTATSEGVMCFGASCSTSNVHHAMPSSLFGSAIFVFWSSALNPANANNRNVGCTTTRGSTGGRVFYWYQEWNNEMYTLVMLHEGSDTVSVGYWPHNGNHIGAAGAIGYQIGTNGVGGYRTISVNAPVFDDNYGESHYWSLTPVDTVPR